MKFAKICLCTQIMLVVTCAILAGLMIKFDKDYERAKNAIIAGDCAVISCLQTDNDYVAYDVLFNSGASQFKGSLMLYHNHCLQNDTIIDCWNKVGTDDIYASYPNILNKKWIMLPIILGLCLIDILFVLYVVALAKYEKKLVEEELIQAEQIHTIL